MDIIKEINIKYFRSIYNIKLKELNDCLIFSGKNDVGKSNILKALNLFFNNQTDWKTEFKFYNDFNFQRLSEVREKSIKGKQYIQIEIKFRRGSGFQNTLPTDFTVKKTWDRYSSIPKESNNLERKLSQGKINNSNLKIIHRSMTQYLNKVKFEYVPAIKDQRLFSHLLNELQDEIFSQLTKKGEEISGEIRRISDKYSESVIELKEEFQETTGIKSELALPVYANELFKVLNVVTDFDDSGNTRLNLDFRGDGIRLRYIPSLYNFLAVHHRGNYILGFEEPENSMEYGLGAKMARKFFDTYSKSSQIFIASHSPAFLDSTSSKVNFFRVHQEDGLTQIVKLKLIGGLLHFDKKDDENLKLSEELGLTELQRTFHKEYEKIIIESEHSKKIVNQLSEQIKRYTKPILYTEGKTDVLILNIAWEKLHPVNDIPIEILPVESTSVDGGDGGFGALNRKIESIKESEKLQIGLYDRDEAGYKKGFLKLNKNLLPYNNSDFVKMHKNGRSFAIVLPPQDGLEEFVKYTNLPLEFLFCQDDLNKKDDKGNGLIIKPFQQTIKFGNQVVDSITKDNLYFSSIESDTKKGFAEKIVPTFDVQSFSYFNLIFDTILQIIETSASD
ncbi:AAA family ATPase [bacterium]|nr:AAA family ATPase [bacterium]